MTSKNIKNTVFEITHLSNKCQKSGTLTKQIESESGTVKTGGKKDFSIEPQSTCWALCARVHFFVVEESLERNETNINAFTVTFYIDSYP
jgi:hypothetical protein